MQQKVKLTCSLEEFDEIHQAVSNVRAGSKTARVDIEAIQKLLSDHSMILKEVDYEDPIKRETCKG